MATFIGTTGNDLLFGSNDDDILYGNGGNDYLDSGLIVYLYVEPIK
jgi:Ca2+-binding RTX toxin-like protein